MIKDTHETNPSLFKERLALKTTKLSNWELLTQSSTQPETTGQLSDDLAELLDCLMSQKLLYQERPNLKICSFQPMIK